MSERNMDRFASTALRSLSIVRARLRAARRMRSRATVSSERKLSISLAISWGSMGSHSQPAPEVSISRQGVSYPTMTGVPGR